MSLTVSPFQATGVLVPPAGYLRAVRRICDDHGALLILDEVMCGMGRTGTNYYHAWQAEGADAPPDIQTVAKGVSGGYAPVAMVLASQAVVDGINHASGIWNHGHTFTSHPVSCAAALAVQTVIKRENLVRHAAEMGSLLGAQLRGALGHHHTLGIFEGGDCSGPSSSWRIGRPRGRSSLRMGLPRVSTPWGCRTRGIYSCILAPARPTASRGITSSSRRRISSRQRRSAILSDRPQAWSAKS